MQKRGFRNAVFVVAYKKTPEGFKYILLHRKKHWRGWEFPKGGVEQGEKLRKAVLRELKEETGLKAKKLTKYNIQGKYLYKRKFSDRPTYLGQTYSLWSTEVKNGKTRFDHKEHSGFKWLPFDKAIKKLRFNNQKRCLDIVNKRINKS